MLSDIIWYSRQGLGPGAGGCLSRLQLKLWELQIPRSPWMPCWQGLAGKPSQGWVIVGDTLLSWERLLAQLPLLSLHAHSIVGLLRTACLSVHRIPLPPKGTQKIRASSSDKLPYQDSWRQTSLGLSNLKQLPLTPGTCQPPQGVRISRYNRVEATLVLASCSEAA